MRNFREGFNRGEREARKNAINIVVEPSMKTDAYDLTVEKNAVNIKGGSSKAVFYAMQSLRQMIPGAWRMGRKWIGFGFKMYDSR